MGGLARGETMEVEETPCVARHVVMPSWGVPIVSPANLESAGLGIRAVKGLTVTDS